MYSYAIFWMLTWPVLLIISYQLIKLAVKKYKKKSEIQKESV